MLLPLFVVLVWGSATSRPYADICAVILRIPRIISFANEDYPAPSYCGTPSPDFFVHKQKSWWFRWFSGSVPLKAASALGFAEPPFKFPLVVQSPCLVVHCQPVKKSRFSLWWFKMPVWWFSGGSLSY
ncbi:hypothetical protein LNP17_29980 [Klebsiella variicola subsp. variicola]|nr:hypothetical protein [Klebsiella variicola subsp. variicola]